MNRLPEDYQLSNRELRILLALAAGPSSGYGVAEQYQEDAHDELKLSNGTLFPALKRLEVSARVLNRPAPPNPCALLSTLSL